MTEDPDFATMTADEIGQVIREQIKRLNDLQLAAAPYGASLTMEIADATSVGDQSRCYIITAWGPGARSLRDA